MTPIDPRSRIAAATLLLLPFAGTAFAAPVLPDFASAVFLPGAAIDNPFFPITPGISRTYRAEGTPFSEHSVMTGQSVRRTIQGIDAAIQLDQAYEDGVLVEETYDYYAQDTQGNVWYLGEDVTNYRYDEEGNFLGTDSASAWLTGVNGAAPGFAMAADPAVGFSYYQEYAAADGALDEALIWETGLTLDVGGTMYTEVLKILETSSLDPALREFKYYAPGIGLIRADEGLSDQFDDPELVFKLVPSAAVPVPAALPCLVLGLGALGALAHRRRH